MAGLRINKLDVADAVYKTDSLILEQSDKTRRITMEQLSATLDNQEGEHFPSFPMANIVINGYDGYLYPNNMDHFQKQNINCCITPVLKVDSKRVVSEANSSYFFNRSPGGGFNTSSSDVWDNEASDYIYMGLKQKILYTIADAKKKGVTVSMIRLTCREIHTSGSAKYSDYFPTSFIPDNIDLYFADLSSILINISTICVENNIPFVGIPADGMASFVATYADEYIKVYNRLKNLFPELDYVLYLDTQQASDMYGECSKAYQACDVVGYSMYPGYKIGLYNNDNYWKNVTLIKGAMYNFGLYSPFKYVERACTKYNKPAIIDFGCVPYNDGLSKPADRYYIGGNGQKNSNVQKALFDAFMQVFANNGNLMGFVINTDSNFKYFPNTTASNVAEQFIIEYLREKRLEV